MDRIAPRKKQQSTRCGFYYYNLACCELRQGRVNQNINEREKELVESYDFAPFMPKHRASKRGASSKMKDQPIESKKEEGGEGNPGGGMVNERTSSESSCQIRRNSVVAPLASLSLGWVVIYADRLSLSPLLNLIKGEFRLSYAAVSLVVSIYFLTYVSFTIPATIFAGRFGYKEGIVFFLSLAAISFGLAGIFGYSFYLLLFLIAIQGEGLFQLLSILDGIWNNSRTRGRRPNSFILFELAGCSHRTFNPNCRCCHFAFCESSKSQ